MERTSPTAPSPAASPASATAAPAAAAPVHESERPTATLHTADADPATGGTTQAHTYGPRAAGSQVDGARDHGDGWLNAAAPDALPSLGGIDASHLRAAASHFAAAHGRVLANPHHEPQVDTARRTHARHAAVLIGFQQQHDGALELLLTERQAGLRFAGHIAFPGGHRDAGDASATATALREAEEEIGLASAQVRVLGELPPYYSHAGHCIVGVLAVVAREAAIQPNPHEVARVLRLPARALFDPRAFRLVRRSTQPYRANYHWRAHVPNTGAEPPGRGGAAAGDAAIPEALGTLGGPTLSLLIHLYSALAQVIPR